MSDKVDEGQSVVDELANKDGSHPETISWSQYVGVKESLGKKLDTATQKVIDLEEQAKKATSTEVHEKVVTDLTKAQEDLKTANTALKVISDKSVADKRETLKGRGIPEDQITAMTEEQLNTAVGVLEHIKPVPKADLGGGGGSSSIDPKTRPMELARQAYATSNRK